MDQDESEQRGASGSDTPFQCGVCQRTYSRLDHLSRHVRIHRKERPYRCETCSKCFARLDLLKRHSLRHEQPANHQRTPTSRETESQVRVTQACGLCAEMHVRCEEQKPCRRCRKRGVPCLPSPASSTQSPIRTAPIISDAGDNIVIPTASSIITNAGHESSADNVIFANTTEDTTALINDVSELPESESSLLLAELMVTGLSDPTPSGTWTPCQAVDFGATANLELNDLDWGFLDSYNTLIPFDHASPSITRGAHNSAAIGTHAFQKSSVWRYQPNKQNNKAVEENQLATSGAEASSNVDSMRLTIRPHCPLFKETLKAASRDRILAGVVRNCTREGMARLVTGFPSLDLLNILIEYLFSTKTSMIQDLLHVPTFILNQARPELLTVLVAAGAVLTPDSALQKLGYALQETARIQMAHIFESDNTSTRDLELLQAFYLIMHIGIWSGNDRKLEIAESFIPSLITMLRRGGRFKTLQHTVSTEAHSQDNVSLSKQNWLQWVQTESFKRLTFHLAILDMESSMSLLRAPLISYAELLLALPESRQKWLASSLDEWKGTVESAAADTTRNLPSLVDLLNGPSLLSRCDRLIDVRTAGYALLCGAWGMVSEYNRIDSLTKSSLSQGSASSIIMRSRYEELQRMLLHIRLCLDECLPRNNDILLRLSAICMHLHVSLDDIQLFAGIDGDQEASRVSAGLHKWMKTQMAREAVWHAGQVVRISRLFSKAILRDFAAVAIYHACLTLWVFGLLMQRQAVSQPPTLTSPKDSEIWVCLSNDALNADVQRFIQFARGMPFVEASVGPAHPSRIQLADPRAIVDLVLNAFEDSFDLQGPAKPPLVDNLMQLMTGLRDVASNIM